MATKSDRLTDLVRSGHTPAIARMISRVERGADGVSDQIGELYFAGGRAWIVGITGPPGAGKSTLVGAMASELRARGRTVGVIAVDPSSPFSGGAILGDRIRFNDLTGDPGVFIRSMATRGALGGLTRATLDAVTVLDAAGMDVVLIETVGSGQDEVDIARAAHVTLVVSVPGLGDDIQVLKAGVIEIADIHVVNKADREGADRTAAELKTMLNLGGKTPQGGWKPPVLKVVASRREGVLELVDRIEQHRAWMTASGELELRQRRMAADRIRTIASRMLLDHLQDPSRGRDFETAVDEVSGRRRDPFTAARSLITQIS